MAGFRRLAGGVCRLAHRDGVSACPKPDKLVTVPPRSALSRLVFGDCVPLSAAVLRSSVTVSSGDLFFFVMFAPYPLRERILHRSISYMRRNMRLVKGRFRSRVSTQPAGGASRS